MDRRQYREHLIYAGRRMVDGSDLHRGL